MQNKEIKIIGVDLGGTNVRAALIVDGEILSHASNLVPQSNNPNDILQIITQTIENVWDNEIQAIGVGVPGILDTRKGIVYDIQNIPSWKKVAVKDYLYDIFRVPVFINNDANCFALGERYFGKGQNSRNFVGLAIGTGIGGGIINQGKLIEDANCGSGEFGMLPYLDSIYEDYCSGQFFKKKYNVDGTQAFQRALAGDTEYLDIFNELGKHLGHLIKTIYYTIDPEKIIIGGSIARAFHLFSKAMWKEIDTFVYDRIKKNIKIEVSDLQHPAILGAASLCYSNLNLKTHDTKQ